jgi:hypothetical protein
MALATPRSGAAAGVEVMPEPHDGAQPPTLREHPEECFLSE